MYIRKFSLKKLKEFIFLRPLLSLEPKHEYIWITNNVGPAYIRNWILMRVLYLFSNNIYEWTFLGHTKEQNELTMALDEIFF